LNKNPVEQIKKQAENNDKKLDNVSEEFLEEYDDEYGIVLNKQKPVYYSVNKIMNSKDVLVFYLMNYLVVSMENNEKESRKDLKMKIKEFKNNCKKTLESVIKDKGGYKRKGYKKDNNEDIKDTDLKNKLVDAFRPKPFNAPKTSKSYAFFKSF